MAEPSDSGNGNIGNLLAGAAPPFESLINLADPRFLTPGDMPAKVQAYCKETGQTVPRKPGPILRCVLESLALLYRKTLREIEQVTGQKIERLYIVGGGTKNTLLNHFTANALQLPVVLGPREASAHTFLNDGALEIGKDAEHAEHSLAARGGRVDALGSKE